ncbi:hypothetical protein OVA03_00390 [Asticcacaulis sp. SL142]|uniref:hypothetical protein n=1 Tax=Asticcacaulis sp. SL142 TaxID=2995155 RepID=UPI00226C6ABB|nr:hypothetical protein [Asticcacaulis sp. SL142]WAC48426.1 hypothetical protein OVA03_00390 [Asticcacaulis sp. SL142]
MARMRSPNYPSLSLTQSVDMVAKIHRLNRTNVITREDAAHALGYSGLTGRSMTVIAALIQFGLLSRVGTGDVRVTQTAVEILHAENERERNEALIKAAFTPQLFRDIHERFPDGIPSEGPIKSYLIKQEFSDTAVGPAISAFMETYREVENLKENESYSHPDSSSLESTEQSKEVQMQQPPSLTPMPLLASPILSYPVSAHANGVQDLNKVNMDIRGDKVQISGIFDIRGLSLLEKKVAALKTLLALQAEEELQEDGRDADYLEAKDRI